MAKLPPEAGDACTTSMKSISSMSSGIGPPPEGQKIRSAPALAPLKEANVMPQAAGLQTLVSKMMSRSTLAFTKLRKFGSGVSTKPFWGVASTTASKKVKTPALGWASVYPS